CVIATLDEATFADVNLFAMSRLDLEIVPIPERAYYASIASVYRPIRIMIVVTAILIATAGVLGGLNTMYAAFASRVREVGMLQSLGFTRGAVAISLTEESVFISCCGGLLGCALGLMVLDGMAIRFSMGAFAVRLDPPVVLAGMGGALLVGLIGAIPPVVRCLRLPIPEALNSV
ncbi:MAG: ABC transporter permease, partial [Phycisphaerales bacterium]|nr:ABC transporter permease [Phycisphaerales bacterium]